MTHTPGPWGAISDGKIITMTGARVVIGLIKGGFGHEVQEANAHLIAAAPELLAALYELINARDYTLEHGGDILTSCSWAKAESAVAKVQPN